MAGVAESAALSTMELARIVTVGQFRHGPFEVLRLGLGITLALPKASGLAAATNMLLAMQPLNIALARQRVSGDIGTPVRTSKVTV